MPEPKSESFSQKVVLIIITAIVGFVASYILLFVGPKNAETKTKPDVPPKNKLINNTSSTQITSNRPHRRPDVYVEVELNVNSNDKVLVNGALPTASEISDKPNFLKLISGETYRIKINNCPEKEITPSPNKENYVSVCM